MICKELKPLVSSEVKKELDDIIAGKYKVNILYCDHCGYYHRLEKSSLKINLVASN